MNGDRRLTELLGFAVRLAKPEKRNLRNLCNLPII